MTDDQKLLGAAAHRIDEKKADQKADHTKAEAQLLAVGGPTPPPEHAEPDEAYTSTWTPIDTARIVDGILTGHIRPPTPELLLRADGEGLLYAGKVNGVAGASGEGKSLIAQWACKQQLDLGHHCVFIDLEDDAVSVLGRLLAMGATEQQLAEHFTYIHPDEHYSQTAQQALEELVKHLKTSLVVIDSTGEALALDGLQQNDDKDVAHWFQKLPRRLANLGAAVLVIDHLTKAPDAKHVSPIGSQRKKSAISGAQYITQTKTAFAKDRPGELKLICVKDRAGNFKAGEVAAIARVDGSDTSILIELTAPETAIGPFRPTQLMQRISEFLEGQPEPLGRNQILAQVAGQKQALGVALGILAAEGYLVVDKSCTKHAYKFVREYVRAVDDLDHE